jgi:hypothetical protein
MIEFGLFRKIEQVAGTQLGRCLCYVELLLLVCIPWRHFISVAVIDEQLVVLAYRRDGANAFDSSESRMCVTIVLCIWCEAVIRFVAKRCAIHAQR